MKIIKIEESELSRYVGKDYADYKYGDVVNTAKEAEKTIQEIEKLVKDSITKIKKQAGSFMSPALVSAFKKDLEKAIK